jgi:hypothetical protein
MTQPYPFTHTADTLHAKASAATRLRSSRLVANCAESSLHEHAEPYDSRILHFDPHAGSLELDHDRVPHARFVFAQIGTEARASGYTCEARCRRQEKVVQMVLPSEFQERLKARGVTATA